MVSCEGGSLCTHLWRGQPGYERFPRSHFLASPHSLSARTHYVSTLYEGALGEGIYPPSLAISQKTSFRKGGGPLATRIYVGNLPYSATNESLAQLFASYGEVTEAIIVLDRATGQSKGFGFVQMTNDAQAHAAITQLNGTEWDMRAIHVNEARERVEGSRRNDRDNRSRTYR